MDRNTYYGNLREFNFSASSFEEIATFLMVYGVKEMYHVVANEDDILPVLTIPNFKIFWCCRCHLVADDGSTGHEHWHALVQFEGGHTLLGYKKRLQRAKQQLHRKTTFKRILCADHVVGVLRYICCNDGQRQTKRGQDGLMGAPHTHYDRSVFQNHLLHDVRGKHCVTARDEICAGLTLHLSTEWLRENQCAGQNSKDLHDFNTCLCDRGKKKLEEKKIANERRRNFYKTDEGKAVKTKYRQKNVMKRKLIAEISKVVMSKKAELNRESILTLLNML